MATKDYPMKQLLPCLLFILVFGTTAYADTRSLITQSTSTDCGPSALATLLQYYLEVPTTETEMMRFSKYRSDTGTTLLGLEQAATSKGCAAGSFLMSYTTLKEQLAAFPAPVIVRTLNPEPHFSVLLSVDRDYVYLADPATGNIVLRKEAFWKRWYVPQSAEGFVFIVASPGQRVNIARVARTVGALRQSLRNLESNRLWIVGFGH